LYGVSENEVDFKKLSKALDQLYKKSPGFKESSKNSFLSKVFRIFRK